MGYDVRAAADGLRGAYRGWARRIGGDGHVRQKVGWSCVCAAETEYECQRLLEQYRHEQLPWRNFALTEYVVLRQGERPEVTLRRSPPLDRTTARWQANRRKGVTT